MLNYKFRAFYNGRMHYSDQVINYKNCQFYPMAFHEGVEQKDIILMQFSGESDSRDHKIYEDDILEIHLPSGQRLPGVVTFNNGEFLWNETSLHKIVKSFKTEVHTNIHEKPNYHEQ